MATKLTPADLEKFARMHKEPGRYQIESYGSASEIVFMADNRKFDVGTRTGIRVHFGTDRAGNDSTEAYIQNRLAEVSEAHRTTGRRFEVDAMQRALASSRRAA